MTCISSSEEEKAGKVDRKEIKDISVIWTKGIGSSSIKDYFFNNSKC